MKVYREPNVWIEVTTDGFAFEGPTMNLRPIIFGTMFQVEVKTALGSYTNSSGLSASYPDLKTDADVDTDTVELYLVHTDTGEEYDITEGLVDGGVEPTFGASSVTIPALMYDAPIDSTTGIRAATGDEFSDSAEDFTDLRYGDKLVLIDNNNEMVTVNQVDTNDNIELVIQYAKNIIYYDALVVGEEFAVGDIVVGASSTATATVMYNHENADGLTGYILLGPLNPLGTPFQDNENLQVSSVTIAVADGANVAVGTSYKLAYTTLSAPGAIVPGDVLAGPAGADQILNGDFASDLSDWTAGAQWAWNAGVADVAIAGAGTFVQTVTTFVAGNVYHVEFTLTVGAADIVVSAGGVTLATIAASGTYAWNFVATSAAPLTFTPAALFTGDLDDVSSGECSGGTVLYEEVYSATDGFVLMTLTTAGITDGQNLTVDDGTAVTATVAVSDGQERLFSDGYIGLIDSPSILYYDALTVSFLAGQTLTGGTSAAVAEILYVYESGTTGYLYLGTRTGVPFQDNETITDDQTVPGSATTNGLDAKAEVDQVLYFDALTAPAAISIGDTLEGAGGAQGIVLYVEEDGVDGFVLLHMGDPLTVFVDNEALDVGAAQIATAYGTNAAITITVSRSYEIRRYLEGNTYVSYRAARADLDGSVYYISKYSDVLALAEAEEAVIPENPLAYAGKICTDLKSDCFLVPVQDLESYQDSTDSTNSSLWSQAFLLARDLETPYGYVVLTQNNTVRALLEVAINWKRDPDNYMNEAVGYFSMARVTENVIISERTANEGALIDAYTWQDSNISDFLAYGCRVGKTLELIDSAGAVTGGAVGQVYKFITNNVTADALTTITAMTTEQRNIKDYRYVDEYYDYDQEATYYAIYGDAIQNKGIRLIYPPTCEFESTEVPTHYLGVIRAAQLNINKPATIYTKALTPFVERVITPFNKTQLNKVAQGGITVYHQENTDTGVGSLPVKCRDAITTDRSISVNEEEVVVTEIDYCTRYIRGVFYPEMGRHHNDEMLDDGIATLAGGCQSHLVTGIKCVVSLELDSYVIDEDEVRKTIYNWSLEPRIPNKWADMTIHVVT